MTKSKKPLIYSLLFLGIIILGGLIYFIATPTQQLTIPSTCQPSTTSTGIGLFKCSTNASICTATIKLECNTPTTTDTPSNPMVIFRTNAQTKSTQPFVYHYLPNAITTKSAWHGVPTSALHPIWIAIDLNANDPTKKGTLTTFTWKASRWEQYTESRSMGGTTNYYYTCSKYLTNGEMLCDNYAGTLPSMVGSPVYTSQGIQMMTPDGYIVRINNNQLYIYYGTEYHLFEANFADTRIDTSTVTKEPYHTNNQEILSGGLSPGGPTTSYTCTESSSGNVVRTLTCSSSSPCTKSESFQLLPGQEVRWGGRIDSVTITNMNSECTRDMPNPSDPQSYYQCIINSYGCGAKASNPTSCPPGTSFMASEAICKLPFTFTVSTDKQTYETGSQIIATPKLTDTNLLNGFAGQVCAYKLSGEIVTCKAFTTGSNGMATVTLDAINSIGTYEVIASIKHQSVRYTQTYSNKVNVNYADSLLLRMYANSPQNTGQIEVFAVVSDSSGQPHEGFFDFAGSICGTTDITASIQQPRFQTNQEDGALYKILVNIGSPCDLTVKAKVMDSSGYTSKPFTQFVRVKRASLIIEQINEESIQNEKEGRYTYQFFVFNEDREPIEPSTIGVIVQERGGCYTGKTCTARGSEFYGINIPAITVTKVDTGKYQFAHTWEEGLNILTISAEDAYLGLARNEYKSNVLLLKGDDVIPDDYCELYPDDPGCTEYCILHPTDVLCEDDYCTLYPNDDKCKPSTFPTELVIGIAVGVLSLAIFFVIVFKKPSKKRRK